MAKSYLCKVLYANRNALMIIEFESGNHWIVDGYYGVYWENGKILDCNGNEITEERDPDLVREMRKILSC